MSFTCTGREVELEILKSFLNKTLSGSFQICFIVGEAGSGKTTLLEGFTSIVEEIAPNAIVAFGECDAQTGLSDPYLPFKEVLSILTGDTESSKLQKRFTSNSIKNLGKFAATSLDVLLEIGPDLIGSIVPAGALITRGIKVLSDKSEIIKKIKERIDNPLNAELNQSTIFQEYTNVLVSLSKKRPLILFLDDLHWVDNASASLLFHLSRKLTSSRVMLVGTYRPNEVQTQTNGMRHPMDAVINEIKRYFGDVAIDLDEYAKSRGFEFINALIDGEPNQLTHEFRTQLYSLTEGNALFASELLQSLKENGNLSLDINGRWCEQTAIDWQVIPTKVEGVIQERVSRLEDELKEILTIASVEGENFTAQVISRLQTLSERLVIHELSSELEKKHRLIMEDGELKIGSGYLNFFRFSHSLIHKYLYNEMGSSERRILHKQVAQTLELLYQNQIDLASTQLARHYEEAGETEKAIYYLKFSADKAVRISAFEDAKSLLEKALKLGTSDITALGELQLLLGIVYFGTGDYPTSQIHLENSLKQFQTLNDEPNLANNKFHLSRTLAELGKFELAEKHARDCIDIAERTKQHDLLIKGISQLAYVIYMTGDAEQAIQLLEKSLKLEKAFEEKLGHVWRAYSLYTLGCCQIVMKDLLKAEEAFQEGAEVAKFIGNREIESYCLTDLGFVTYEKAEYDKAKLLFEEGLKLGTEINAQWTVADALCGFGFLNTTLGNYSEAMEQFQNSLKIFHESKTITGILLDIVGFAQLLSKQDRYSEALQLLGLSQNYSSKIADIDHYAELVILDIKGKVDENLISQEIEMGKKLDFESTVRKLLN